MTASAPAHVADVAQEIGRLDASLLAASTVKVARISASWPRPTTWPRPWRSSPSTCEAIVALAVGQYDFVLLDVSRTLDTMAIRRWTARDRSIAVLQASLPYMRNAAKGSRRSDRSATRGQDRIDHQPLRKERRDRAGRPEARTLGTPTLNTIPNPYGEVNTSINQGDAGEQQWHQVNSVVRQLAEWAMPSAGPTTGRGLFAAVPEGKSQEVIHRARGRDANRDSMCEKLCGGAA